MWMLNEWNEEHVICIYIECLCLFLYGFEVGKKYVWKGKKSVLNKPEYWIFAQGVSRYVGKWSGRSQSQTEVLSQSFLSHRHRPRTFLEQSVDLFVKLEVD